MYQYFVWYPVTVTVFVVVTVVGFFIVSYCQKVPGMIHT
jgi:hypothetical protein